MPSEMKYTKVYTLLSNNDTVPIFKQGGLNKEEIQSL